MWEFLKKHYGKIFVGTSGTIIFTIAGTLFSDARYVHASDHKKEQLIQKAQIEELRTKIENLSKK